MQQLSASVQRHTQLHEQISFLNGVSERPSIYIKLKSVCLYVCLFPFHAKTIGDNGKNYFKYPPALEFILKCRGRIEFDLRGH